MPKVFLCESPFDSFPRAFRRRMTFSNFYYSSDVSFRALQTSVSIAGFETRQTFNHTLMIINLTYHFQILSDKKFKSIEKIKTIGETYMAASGLSPDSAVSWKFITYLGNVLW